MQVLYTIQKVTMIRRFDNKIERIIAHLRNPLATRFFLSVTHLGGPIAITLLTCTLLILLLVSEEVNLAKGLVVAVAGSALLGCNCKIFVRSCTPSDNKSPDR
jgi:hypothetical protein